MNIAILLLCALLLTPVDAAAHRVNVFAWLEGDTVHVQAGFSRKNPARQSAVAVLSGSEADVATASVLLSGTTDNNGAFSFPLPPEAREHGLTICVNAGQGHQNEWRMKAKEFVPAQTQATNAAPSPATHPQPAPHPEEDGPRLRDIVGGLGWIVGFVGIAMAVRARRRRV